MTVQDIITLSKAGFTAQQITQMSQPQMAQQMVQQMPQMPQPQMAEPQMLQHQMLQPQMVHPQMAQPQMVQPQMAQYMPVLPQTTQTDQLKDIMLQQYTNAGQNMYNMNDVVANMIGANAPVNTEKK